MSPTFLAIAIPAAGALLALLGLLFVHHAVAVVILLLFLTFTVQGYFQWRLAANQEALFDEVHALRAEHARASRTRTPPRA